MSFITSFLDNINQYFKNKKIYDFAHKQVMEEAFGAVKALLTSEHQEKKAKSLLAVAEMEPCGILVGNVAKKQKIGNKLVYSSRKNHASKETELDWLTTWNAKLGKKMKNTGMIDNSLPRHIRKHSGHLRNTRRPAIFTRKPFNPSQIIGFFRQISG